MRMPVTLWRYLLAAYVRALLLSCALFTAVLFLFFFVRFSRLVERFGLPPESLLGAMPGLLPYVLSYSLPMACMAAAVVAFGSFAEAREYTAAAAAGISPWRLAAPVLVLAAALSILNVWLYDGGTRLAFEHFRAVILDADRATLRRELRPGRSVVLPGGERDAYLVHFFDRTPAGTLPVYLVHFRDGLLEVSMRSENSAVRYAAKGEKEIVLLDLRDAEIVQTPRARREGGPDEGEGDARTDGDASRSGRLYRIESLPLFFSVDREVAKRLPLGRSKSTASLSENRVLRDRLAGEIAGKAAAGESVSPLTVRQYRGLAAEVERKYSMSLACLALTLLGLPLGLLARRGSRSTSFALAVLVCCILYLPMIVAIKALAGAGYVPPETMWLPTVLAAAAGPLLIIRVGRTAA